MKKLFIFIVLLIMPYAVSAMAVSETFKVGDSVSVGLINDNERIGFHVLKDSSAGEQTVTLIYDGVISMSTLYDETVPADNHDASVIFSETLLYKKMNEIIYKDGARWRVERADILSLSDLADLNISKNINGIYEIKGNNSFLAPRNVDGLHSSQYNYWTSVSENNDSVYCVAYNENRKTDNDVWATLELKNITSITNNEKCALRPVVVVDKKYIICNNTNPTQNVETGVKDYIIPLSAIILIASIAIVLVNKKSVFKEI